MKVLVCGGRDYADRDAVYRRLDAIHAQSPIEAVIDGDATGADELAGDWAERNGICSIKVRAHWTRFSRGAGPIRNGWMLKYCQPELVIAFPGETGTANMVEKAKAAGVRVLDLRTPSPQTRPSTDAHTG